jgi:hypothetical protein
MSSDSDPNFIDDAVDTSDSDSDFVPSTKPTRRERHQQQREASRTLAITQRNLRRLEDKRFSRDLQALASLHGISTVSDKIEAVLAHKAVTVRQSRIASAIKDLQDFFRDRTYRLSIGDEVIIHSCKRSEFLGTSGIVTLYDNRSNRYEISTGSGKTRRHLRVRAGCLSVRNTIIEDSTIVHLLVLLAESRTTEARAHFVTLVNGCRNPPFQLMMVSLSRIHAPKLSAFLYELVERESASWSLPPYVVTTSLSDSEFSCHEDEPPSVAAGFFGRPAPERTRAISEALSNLEDYATHPNFVPFWDYDNAPPRPVIQFVTSHFNSDFHRRLLERTLYGWYCFNNLSIGPSEVETFMSILATLDRNTIDQVHTACHAYFQHNSPTFYNFIRACLASNHHNRPRSEHHGNHSTRLAPIEHFTDATTHTYPYTVTEQGKPDVALSHRFNPAMPALVDDNDTSDDKQQPQTLTDKPPPSALNRRDKRDVEHGKSTFDSYAERATRERAAENRFMEEFPHHFNGERAQCIEYVDDTIFTAAPNPRKSLSSLRHHESQSPSSTIPPAPAPSLDSQIHSRHHARSNSSSIQERTPHHPQPLSATRVPTLDPPQTRHLEGNNVLVIPTEKAPKLMSAISDISSLVQTFLPAYRIYSRSFSRQSLQFQTIFECLTEQQQRTFQLSSQLTYDVLTALSNDQLLDQFRHLWGLHTAASALQQLRSVRFQGDALEIESWILLQNDFSLILEQVAPRGLPSDKELVRAFIALCPFGFMRQELTNANVRHWEAAFDIVRQLLQSVDFMRDAAKQANTTRSPNTPFPQGGGHGGNGGSHGSNGSSHGSNGGGHSGNSGSHGNNSGSRSSNGGGHGSTSSSLNGNGSHGGNGNSRSGNTTTPPSSTTRQSSSRSQQPSRTPFTAAIHGERQPERRTTFAATDTSPYSTKQTVTPHCQRCGLDGHDHKQCVRKHHVDGSLINPPLSDDDYQRRRAAMPQRSHRIAPIRNDDTDQEDDYKDRPPPHSQTDQRTPPFSPPTSSVLDDTEDEESYEPHFVNGQQTALLSPPIGCGFILPSPYPPSSKDMFRRIKFVVDSRCESHSVIRTSLAKRLKLKISKCDPIACNTATNEEISCTLITSFTLGIFINHQWSYFCVSAMVWPDLCDELIICNKFALETNLIRFCLPNNERLTCIGRPAICPTDIDWHAILQQDDDDVQDEFHREVMNEDDENIIDLSAPLMFNSGAKFSELSAVNQAWARIFPNFLLPFPEYSHPDIPEFDAHILMSLVASYASTQQEKNFYKPIRSSDKARDKFRDVITELRAKHFVTDSLANPHGVASVAHLIPKPNGKPRFVVNCSRINKCLQLQMYPLPTIQEAHVFVGRFRWYASLDLESGYFNISIKPSSRWITRTIGPGFAIEWMRCTQGLAPMVSFFQWAMDTILQDFKAFVFVYLDDIIVGGNSEEEVQTRIHTILERLHSLNFRISFKKSALFASRSIHFLGRTFTNGFLVPGPNTSILLSKIVHPNAHTSDKHARTALRSFLGAGNYLRPHMPDWPSAVAPLYLKSTGPWTWTASDQAAWNAGIACLANLKPLQVPSDLPDAHFEIFTDASDIGWAAVLFQRQHAGTTGVEDLRLIQWDGGSFSPKQADWTIHQREMMAVYQGFKSFHHFIRLHRIILYIDNMVLTYMDTSANPMIQRWYAFIQDYNFSVFHIRSEANPLCDAFSRLQARFGDHACIKHTASSVVASITSSNIAVLTRSGTTTTPVHSRRRTLRPDSPLHSPATPQTASSQSDEPSPPGIHISLVEHDVQSDGACCFHALLSALSHLYVNDTSFRFPPVDDAQHLRDCLVDWIQDHLHTAPATTSHAFTTFHAGIHTEYVTCHRELRDSEYYRSAVEHDLDPIQQVHSVTSYLATMRRPSAYGDEFVIQACAEKYSLQIVVLGDERQCFTALTASHRIYLIHNLDHYIWAHLHLPPSNCAACERLPHTPASIFLLHSALPVLPNPASVIDIPRLSTHPTASSIDDAQPLLPYHLQWIQEAHCGTAGHPGRDATIALLKARNQHWRGRFTDVSKFIDRCSTCILSRLHHVPLPSLNRSISLTARIARRWHGDLSGAYPVCQTRGHQYVITFVDEVSGFGFFRGAANNTAFEVAVTLLELSGLFGVPDSIHTDGGSEFDSDIIHQFCDLTSTRHTLSIARAPHTNGVAERSIREVKSVLRLLAADFQRHSTWSPLLPIAQRALNSRYRQCLGCSPQEFLFGTLVGTEAAVIPCEAAALTPSAAADIDAYHPTANFMHRALRFQEQVLHRLQTLSDNDAEAALRLSTPHTQPLIVGELVLIPWRDHRPPSSIHPKLCGPYIVSEIFPERNTLSLTHTCNPPPADQLSTTTWTLEGDVYKYNGIPVADSTTLSSVSHPLPRAIDCVLSCTLVADPLPVPDTPAHVRNHRFLIRFLCSPNVDAIYASYDDVKHTLACDRFCDGHSFLLGHVSSLRFGTDFDSRARPESERPSHPPVATLELTAPVRVPHQARAIPTIPFESAATPARRRRH